MQPSTLPRPNKSLEVVPLLVFEGPVFGLFDTFFELGCCNKNSPPQLGF